MASGSGGLGEGKAWFAAALGSAALLLVVDAAHAQSAAETTTWSVDVGGSVHLDLVLIHAGSFLQGSPANEKERSDDEAQREVTLTQDFYMGRTPVTVGQFTRFVEETGYRTETERGSSGGFGFDGERLVQKPEFNWRNPGFIQLKDQPVTLVTFGDARAFAGWLSNKIHRDVDLPSEAQWEYAYRAGTKTRFYNGDADHSAEALGWFKKNSARGTQPVALKQGNAFGLFDMGGNVYEWCRDWYGPYTPGMASDPEQTTAPSGDKPRRVLRGGSWLKDAKHLRAAARYRNDPGSRNADNGFRVVASLTPKAPAAERPADQNTGAPGTKPTPGADDNQNLLIGLGVMGVGLLAIVGLVAWVVSVIRRGRNKPNQMPGAPPGVRFRPDKDGFWFRAPANLRGSLLHYRATVPGGQARAAVPIEGNDEEQFVYTGARPSEVEAEQVAAWVGAAYMVGAQNAYYQQQQQPQRGHARDARDTSDEDEDDHFSPAFRGYPSAY